MNFSKLRHRITIQENISVKDSFGAETPNWTDVASVWASIEPLSGKEFFAAQQINAEVNTKITMRYREGIKPEMRVVFNERMFNIISVINENERNISLILMAKESINSEEVV